MPLQSSVSLPGAFSVAGPGRRNTIDNGDNDDEWDPEAAAQQEEEAANDENDHVIHPRHTGNGAPSSTPAATSALQQQHHNSPLPPPPRMPRSWDDNADDIVLLQASLVTPSPPLPLVEAKAMVVGLEQPDTNEMTSGLTHHHHSQNIWWKKRGRWIALTVGVLVLAAVAVTVGVVVGSDLRQPANSPTNNSTPIDPSFNPTNWESDMKELYDSLPNETHTAIQNPQSYESNAWHWVNHTLYEHAMAGTTTHDDRIKRLRQRFALALFFYGTGGDTHWIDSGWLNASSHECAWTGTACTRQGDIVQILQSNHNLTGSIPSAVAWLSALTQLDLSRNALTGSIPIDLGVLTNLQYLDLANNALTGSIPTQLGELSNLQFVSVDGNRLNGSVPTELYALTGLLGLSLSTNALTGTLEGDRLGNWTNVTSLQWQNNIWISGTLPSQLGLLTHLTSLRLTNTSVVGSVPMELCDLLVPYGNLVDLALDCDRVNWTCPGRCIQ